MKPIPIEHVNDFFQTEINLGITVAPLDQGMWLEKERVALVTETQLFDDKVAQRRRRDKAGVNADFIIKSLTELKLNDAVVLSLIHI